MNRGKRKAHHLSAPTAPDQRFMPRERTSRISWAHLGLSALLAAVLLPFAPGSLPAQAAVSTSDYALVFDKGSSIGEPADFIDDSTLRCASTQEREHYDFVPSAGWLSGGAFVTKKSASLCNSWEVQFTGDISPLQWRDELNDLSSSMLLGFSSTGDPTDLNGYAWSWGENRNASLSGTQSTMFIWNYAHSVAVTPVLGPIAAPGASTQPGSFSYNAQTDIATLTIGGHSISSSAGIRSIMGDSAYFFVGGAIGWRVLNDPSALCAPDNMQIACTFRSISFPNLDTVLTSALYRLNKETGKFDIPVSDIDELSRNDVVQVRCTVKNANPAASGIINERFSLHLKLSRTDEHPTWGLDPFADDSHPVTVDGDVLDLTVDSAPLTGGTGVPLVIEGYNNPVVVTYYARVSEQGAQSVKISHELTEDTFQVSQFHTIGLTSLKPAPDDPSLIPGRDYHYTRIPVANENGWNNSPVSITFAPGDFDELTIADANDTPIDGGILTADKPIWTRILDTDHLPLQLHARNTTAGNIAGSGTELIKIDTLAPTITHNSKTGAIIISDAAPANSGKATAGVWKVRRVKADGRPLEAESVTPGGDAALAGTADAAAPHADTGQTDWLFPLTNGNGAATQTISNIQPGYYVAEDAAGNVSPIVEVKDDEVPTPPVDPTPPDPDKPDQPVIPDDPTNAPAFPVITPKPDPTHPNEHAPKPLTPSSVDTDPSTNLTHAVVEDTLLLPTSSEAATPSMMGQLIADRYLVATDLTDTTIAASDVQLFDADGNPVTAIDRSKPGTWIAVQTFTDSAGNSTTIRLAIQVRESTVTSTVPSTVPDGTGAKTSNDSLRNPDTQGGGHRSALAASISKLPQTGGLLGPCPLHILFVLIAIMGSAFALARRRQYRHEERQHRQESAPSTDADDARFQQKRAPRRGLAPFDGFVLAVLAACAAALGFLAFCPLDILFAGAAIAVCVFWGIVLHRQKCPRDRRDAETPAVSPV